MTKTDSTRNYGVLTDISKGLNLMLGDRSDRTVSMRTAHGLKKAVSAPDMHDDTAEDIAHLGMIGAGLILNAGGYKKNNFLLVLLFFLLIGLFVCYHLGKDHNV